jgi:DNA-binding response OmpR family regulator
LALARQRPDAAVIDATLRRDSGLALAGELISLGIPVLIITGDPRQIHRLPGRGYPFLIKPFRMSALMAEISQLIGDAAARIAPPFAEPK